MRIEVSGTIDAPVSRVWAWWTDFGEPGQRFVVHHGAGKSTRTILARDARTIIFEDKSLLGVIHRTVTIGEGHTFTEVGRGGQTFESSWSFEVVDDRHTRVVRVMRVRASQIFAPFVKYVTSRDLRYHCREASEALRL